MRRNPSGPRARPSMLRNPSGPRARRVPERGRKGGDNVNDCEHRMDAAAYVLGALDDGGGYRAHLESCAQCRAEVAELQTVVDLLPATVPPAVASRALRGRIMASVRSEAEI